MTWYIYILKSLKDGRFYIGSTSNPEARLIKHNSGGNKSTRNRKPFMIVYIEEYATKNEALAREKVIKSYKGGDAFKKLFDARAGGGVVNRTRL